MDNTSVDAYNAELSKKLVSNNKWWHRVLLDKNNKPNEENSRELRKSRYVLITKYLSVASGQSKQVCNQINYVSIECRCQT